MPWGRDEGILERAWSSRVASKLFFFFNTGGDRGELLQRYSILILLWRASRSPHGPLTTALTALTAQLFASAPCPGQLVLRSDAPTLPAEHSHFGTLSYHS